MRSAVHKVLVEKKLKGQPAIIWRNGKVVKVPAKSLLQHAGWRRVHPGRL